MGVFLPQTLSFLRRVGSFTFSSETIGSAVGRDPKLSLFFFLTQALQTGFIFKSDPNWKTIGA